MRSSVLWWVRSVAAGAGVGLLVGVVVGGTLGRVFMRLVFLAQQDSKSLETSMGGIIGAFTAGGTGAIYVFGGIVGFFIGLGYVAGRTLLPTGMRVRTLVFTLATTLFLLGQVARGNREDFTFLPVTVSLLLVAGAVVLTALPVPLLVERLSPDRPRRPGRAAHGLVALGLAGFGVYAVTGILIAYTV